MCGICGYYGNFSKYIGEEKLRRMLALIWHRGPDDEGIYIKNNTALGMRRLSIVDTEGGSQPMHNERKDIWIVFNGEIYNYTDLKKYLIGKGHEFSTESDTEVIVHLYEEYGEDFVKHIEGMFAIAIWDEKKDRLLLARDRMGVKPLYYSIVNNTIIYASEIKSLFASGIVEKEVNSDLIGIFLQYRYIPGEETMFKNIYKLMPGHMLTFTEGKMKIWQYWDVELTHSNKEKQSEKFYTENIENLVDNSIKNRLTGDVPIGIFLSGGLDSSIILNQASKNYEGNIKTFSVAFKKPEANISREKYNELDYAENVSKHYATEHYQYLINPINVIDDINKIIWHLDEPISDPTAIPLYYVSKLASEYVKVVLSGEGADEIFAGYKIYREPQVVHKYNMIPQFIRNHILEPSILHLPFSYGKNFLKRVKCPISERYSGVGKTFRGNEIYKLLNEELYINSSQKAAERYISSIFKKSSKCKDEVNQMLYFDQKVWLPEDALMKSDKISMANSLELRVPFLDDKLVQFAAKIPSKFKYRGHCEKYILKQAFKNEIPEIVLKRRKNGFPVPITSLLGNEFRQFAKDILLSQRAINRRYFNKNYIEKLINNYNTNNYLGRQIWLLITFEIWNRIFIDQFSLN